jgi:deoxyribodipyrimidine photolyase-related protein
MAEIKTLVAQLIFPHQLFKDTDYLDKSQPIFLVEEFLFFKQYKFHKQKIALHRATMKFYEEYLTEQKFKVEYIESTSPLSDIRKLIIHLEKEKFGKILITDVCDNWLEKRIKETKLELEILDSPLFINTKENLKEYFEDKKSYHQTDFLQTAKNIEKHLNEGGKTNRWKMDFRHRKPKKISEKQESAVDTFSRNQYILRGS